MEEENQVFGKNAEAVDSNINLESEDFYFYHQNKEEAKKNIDSSSKELTDFIDSLIQDIPDPSENEVAEGVKKILERTHHEEAKTKVSQRKKLTFRVLFIAALLSILSFSGLYVVGSSHNISIENGFVTFAKDTIKIVFFGEDMEEYITVNALLTDLELHGYTDILFPQEFLDKSDEYRVSVPEYSHDVFKQVSFSVLNEKTTYIFTISNQISPEERDFLDLKNAETVLVDDYCVYLFEHEKDKRSAEFFEGNYWYSIKPTNSYSDVEQIIKSIK